MKNQRNMVNKISKIYVNITYDGCFLLMCNNKDSKTLHRKNILCSIIYCFESKKMSISYANVTPITLISYYNDWSFYIFVFCIWSVTGIADGVMLSRKSISEKSVIITI